MYFEIYLDCAGFWRWRLCKSNAWGVSIIATSHQGHSNQTTCENEVYSVRQVNGFTPIYYV